ncbi:hypothetical protein JKP88DRAFT_350473 [Tribonema minus]|uniref:RNase III domain-containing protein n=1 Tax=Tribonema minus TaxID=303371 RepID=A0A835YN84_9STRA|nr:hypothetical protein JKP88DRAFT_350473 [Tribonema minus]
MALQRWLGDSFDEGDGAADKEGLQSLVPAAEEALGYEFNDKMLLLQALTLKSFVNEVETATGDNGALEWLGDSVLQCAWLVSDKVKADTFEAVLGAVHLDCREAAATAVPSPVARILAKELWD